MNLRPYQQQCLDKSLERYRAGVNRQLAVLATGLGKAVLFAALRQHHEFRKRVMVLVHREELANQAADKIFHWNPGLMIGVEMANRYAAPMHTFIVASVPTLGRKNSQRILRFDPADFDCIVSDESHHSTSPQWRNVLDHFGLMTPNPEAPLSLGLTATPNRSDGMGLRQCFDEIVFDMGIRQGIESKFLCDLRGIRISSDTSLDAVKVRAGEFADDDLAKTVNTTKRNALIVKEWYKHAFGKKTIVFTVDVQHALDLAEAFKAHGVTAEAIWGDDPERARKLASHRKGETDVLCNCAILTEGYDDPSIGCIVDAAPTKSTLRYTQKIGRGTRICDGKDDCLVMDVVDNCSKHSLMTVSSLLGLPKSLDLKGEKYSAAKERLDRIAREFPTANVQDIKSLDQLKSIAENISLFQVSYPPEISQLSELAWRQQGEGYMLAVNRELVTISKDLRDEFWVRGSINGNPLEEHSQNLPGAFNIADRIVMDSGGSKALLSRDAKWRQVGPSPKQVERCRKWHIPIPNGATREMVSQAITTEFERRSGGRPKPQPVPEYHGEW